MMWDTFLRGVEEVFGERVIVGEKTEEYAVDHTKMGEPPKVVVFPLSVGEIEELMRLAVRCKVPIITRGGGSGSAGGASAVKDGCVICLSMMDRILEVNKRGLYCVVEPGVGTLNLRDYLSDMGLFFPPDPAGMDRSTIGGNVATNAGGMNTLKYGRVGDYVLGLEAVTPAKGRVFFGGYTRKFRSGLDLVSLMVGSEGILGIITKVVLRVLPAPSHKRLFAFGFNTIDDGLDFANRVLYALTPCALEFVDPNGVKLLGQEMGVSWNFETLFLVALDGLEYEVGRDEHRLLGLKHNGIMLDNPGEVWDARKRLSDVLYSLKPNKLNYDFVVPLDRVGEFVCRAKELAEQMGIALVCFGHFGDGNIHTNLMYDAQDEREVARMNDLIGELVDLVLCMRGTISGEHGIGLRKKAFLPKAIGNKGVEFIREIKRVFDPYNIMNPGKVID